jgi:hypothetical protein
MPSACQPPPSLAWDARGRTYLLAADGAGTDCLLRLLDATPPDVDPARITVRILSAPDALSADLSAARMGLRLYLAGSAVFVARARRIAAGFGLGDEEIRVAEVEAIARAVYCVHCMAISPPVATSHARCTGCGRWLRIRDHHSPRLAACLGVQADAEDPAAATPAGPEAPAGPTTPAGEAGPAAA